MEFLIFSDSHGRTEGMELALERQIRRPDGILFLGDGLRDMTRLDFDGGILYDVAGNCDWFSGLCGGDSAPTERILSLEGHTLLMTHGHLYGVKGGQGALLSHAVEVGADLVLYGHTHIPHASCIPAGTQVGNTVLQHPIHFFNPGSIGSDSDGKGLSFGTLTLRGTTVLFSHGRI